MHGPAPDFLEISQVARKWFRLAQKYSQLGQTWYSFLSTLTVDVISAPDCHSPLGQAGRRLRGKEDDNVQLAKVLRSPVRDASDGGSSPAVLDSSGANHDQHRKHRGNRHRSFRSSGERRQNYDHE